MKKLLASLIALFSTLWLHAQDTTIQQQEQTTGMRAGGKIYVVMTVAITILIGLIIYLVRLDRKISKLEK